jgi:hypothetical protein
MVVEGLFSTHRNYPRPHLFYKVGVQLNGGTVEVKQLCVVNAHTGK